MIHTRLAPPLAHHYRDERVKDRVQDVLVHWSGPRALDLGHSRIRQHPNRFDRPDVASHVTTLWRQGKDRVANDLRITMNPAGLRYTKEAATLVDQIVYGAIPIGPFAEVVQHFLDRKSTRLNSCHPSI